MREPHNFGQLLGCLLFLLLRHARPVNRNLFHLPHRCARTFLHKLTRLLDTQQNLPADLLHSSIAARDRDKSKPEPFGYLDRLTAFIARIVDPVDHRV